MSQTTPQAGAWMTSRQVCDALNIHLNTLSRYISRGEFGKILVLSAKDRRINSDAVQAFITRRLAG